MDDEICRCAYLASGCLSIPQTCYMALIASWQLLLADMMHAVHPVGSNVKQQPLPTAGSSGPCRFCLIPAHPCSCRVRPGMWLGARRLIATCLAGQVPLLDAPGREMPLTAEDMFLSGANLVSTSMTQSATCGR